MLSRLLIILLFPFLIGSSNPIKIIQTTATIAQDGRKESNTSMIIKIKLVSMKSSKKITFDKLKLGESLIKFKTLNLSNEFIKTFEKNDTIYLIGYTKHASTNIANKTLELSYRKGKKRFTLPIIIDSIEKTHQK